MGALQPKQSRLLWPSMGALIPSDLSSRFLSACCPSLNPLAVQVHEQKSRLLIPCFLMSEQFLFLSKPL